MTIKSIFIERLLNLYGKNEPIFTDEILKVFSDYSRPRVFQFIKKAEQEEELIQFDKGVYYIPTETRYGKSVISVEQVVHKKYIENKGEIFGIYGGLTMQLNFLLSYQVPNTIEVITNNESTWVREITLRGRRIILRKSRCTINKDNASAYTILELFNTMDVKTYKKDASVRREIISFAKKQRVRITEIIALANVFPSRATKNLVECGFINEIE
ncbi:MAG TPA: hypothetical protein DCY93_01630 [Firmicutes bacterium]|nr:hypothetical protein [Bacillota bacterium]